MHCRGGYSYVQAASWGWAGRRGFKIAERNEHPCCAFIVTFWNVHLYISISPMASSCTWIHGRPEKTHLLSCHAMSCHAMSCHVTSCHVMSHHAMSCHVMSCHAMSCHVMSCHVTSCHVMSHHMPLPQPLEFAWTAMWLSLSHIDPRLPSQLGTLQQSRNVSLLVLNCCS